MSGANPLEADDLVIQSPTTCTATRQPGRRLHACAPQHRHPGRQPRHARNRAVQRPHRARLLQHGRQRRASRSPTRRTAGVVAVGAVDPPAWHRHRYYSSQGPTNDGRIKPDVTAPAGFFSDHLRRATFSGTSAASPVAAGMAALLQGAGLAAPGEGTAALVKHFSADLGAPGPDNVFGAGKIQLPPAARRRPRRPPRPSTSRSRLPVRGLDTRAGRPMSARSALTGPYPTAVDHRLRRHPRDHRCPTSACRRSSSTSPRWEQQRHRLPAGVPVPAGVQRRHQHAQHLHGRFTTARPNFAIVPVGVDGKISIYLQAGGNVIVDVLGYYLDGQTAPASPTGGSCRSPPRALDGHPWPERRAAAGRVRRARHARPTPTRPSWCPRCRPPRSPPWPTVEALVVNITAAGPAGGRLSCRRSPPARSVPRTATSTMSSAVRRPTRPSSRSPGPAR
jgi:hypothetical protein